MIKKTKMFLLSALSLHEVKLMLKILSLNRPFKVILSLDVSVGESVAFECCVTATFLSLWSQRVY